MSFKQVISYDELRPLVDFLDPLIHGMNREQFVKQMPRASLKFASLSLLSQGLTLFFFLLSWGRRLSWTVSSYFWFGRNCSIAFLSKLCSANLCRKTKACQIPIFIVFSLPPCWLCFRKTSEFFQALLTGGKICKPLLTVPLFYITTALLKALLLKWRCNVYANAFAVIWITEKRGTEKDRMADNRHSICLGLTLPIQMEEIWVIEFDLNWKAYLFLNTGHGVLFKITCLMVVALKLHLFLNLWGDIMKKNTSRKQQTDDWYT